MKGQCGSKLHTEANVLVKQWLYRMRVGVEVRQQTLAWMVVDEVRQGSLVVDGRGEDEEEDEEDEEDEENEEGEEDEEGRQLT